MSGWWASGWLVVTLAVAVVNSKVDLDSPLRLAHCRASCIYKINMQYLTDSSCQASQDCSQCWETCRVLQSAEDSVTHCTQKVCGAGCLEACRFHSLSPSQRPPVLLTQHDDVLTVSGHRVSWPPASGTLPVYVIMLRQAQISQTLDTHTQIPMGTDPSTVRVLVVDWRGLATVFSPQSESALVRTQTILRNLGLDKTLHMGQQTNRTDGSYTNCTALLESQNNTLQLWSLREVSMIHQSTLVLVQISWEPQQLSWDCHLTYLVTWEVDGGVLRGNLLTNSSRVTLSLWPDTVYTIKVALFSPEFPGSQSEPLVLDTHHVHTEAPRAIHSHRDTHRHRPDRQTQLVAGIAAAVTVFLVVVLTVTWRWHHHLSLPHSKLVDEEPGTPNLYRVFPPAVRLIGERQDSTQNVFCSTDNLLQDN